MRRRDYSAVFGFDEAALAGGLDEAESPAEELFSLLEPFSLLDALSLLLLSPLLFSDDVVDPFSDSMAFFRDSEG